MITTPQPTASSTDRPGSLGSPGVFDSAILEAADSAKERIKNLGATLTQKKSSWQNTLSSAAMGVAGAAASVGLGALAFYAYHKFGADPAMIVDPQSIRGIGEYGAAHAQAAVRGLGQIDAFMNGLHAGSSQPTMGDFFDQMRRSGVDPEVFKSAVANHLNLLGVKGQADWAARLLDPSTLLTPSLHARINELVWHHDKQVAIHGENANDALVFVKAGFALAAASAASSVASGVGDMTQHMAHMKSVARRTAVDCGLIDEMTDRKVRKSIKETALDAVDARARLAGEYAERQTPMNRFLTMHWVEAARAENRTSMLQLMGLESKSNAKRTSIGQAVMIDHFCAKELRDLSQGEPEHSQVLAVLADRRSELEERGIRPKDPVNSFGEYFPELPACKIAEMGDYHARLGTQQRRIPLSH